MKSYGVALLKDVRMGAPIVEYLERIDATLAPYDGHFIVHGGQAEVVEGADPGTLIVIEFPDRARARAWYESPAYQEILPLRTENSDSAAIIVEGVGDDYRASSFLSRVSG